MSKIIDIFIEFAKSTGIAMFFADGGWKNLIMIIVACVLIFLAIKKAHITVCLKILYKSRITLSNIQ